jgi:O-antigen ligase
MADMRRNGVSGSQRRRPPALVFWAFVGVLALLPWPLGANRDWVWPWFAAAIGGLLAVLFGGAALAAWRLPETLRAAPAWTVALLAWLAWPLLQLALPAAWAPWDPAAAWAAFGTAGLAAGAALLAVGTIDSRSRLKYLVAALFAVGVAQALYGLVLALSGSDGLVLASRVVYRGHATGSFVNRNHFAGFMELTAAFGLALLVAQLGSAEAGSWRARLRQWTRLLLGPKTWVRGLLVVVVLALVLTHSRGGNLAFFVALGAAGMLALATMRPLPRSLAWLLVSIVVLDLLVLGSWFGVEQVTTRLRETAVVATEAGAAQADPQRVDVTRATLELWRQRPVFGVGTGGFRTGFPAVKPDGVTLFYDHAHDDWAQWLAERGAAGLLVWLAFLALSFGAAVRAMRRNDPLLRGVGFGATFGLLALLVHAFVDFNLQLPANAAYFMTLAALAVVAKAFPGARPNNHATRSATDSRPAVEAGDVRDSASEPAADRYDRRGFREQSPRASDVPVGFTGR